jgi:hypothetical protein
MRYVGDPPSFANIGCCRHPIFDGYDTKSKIAGLGVCRLLEGSEHYGDENKTKTFACLVAAEYRKSEHVRWRSMRLNGKAYCHDYVSPD